MKSRKTVFYILLGILYGCGNGGSEGSSSSSSGNTKPGPDISGVCPESEPCKILPFGDAIVEGIELNSNTGIKLGEGGGIEITDNPDGTNGYTHQGGFRAHLFESALADKKSVTFTGLLENGPQSVSGSSFPRSHSGFSAISISNLRRMLPQPVKSFDHDIVLLHAGTHEAVQMTPEMLESGGYNQAMNNLSQIIEELYKINPDGLIAVSNFYGLTPGNTASAVLSQEITDVVETFKKSHTKANILLVDHKSLTIQRGRDAFTPSGVGYKTIADAWYNAIKPYLKSKKG